MANILVNGFQAKSGGGKTILDEFIKIIFESNSNNKYTFVAPNQDDYKLFQNNNIKILTFNYKLKRSFLIPFLYWWVLPKFINKNKFDIIFNLADIGIRTDKKQIFLFDWSYAVYPESIVWKKMDISEWLRRKSKLFFLINQ